jgi:phosphoglycolate phosphatase-like HAD superfamily hydrolase
LIIFDIDGTLCDTKLVDEECFVRSCEAVFGTLPDGLGWQRSPHVTDSAIVDWWCRETQRRAPNEREVNQALDQFLSYLRDSLAAAPHRFQAIAGARELIEAIRQRGWPVAIATGGWLSSAQMKLAAAGLPSELLLASANDSQDRVSIFRLAAERLGAQAHERVVLVGDGTWDVTVAGVLGWRFVGIATGGQASRLRELGAQHVIPNFSPRNEVLSLLAAA